MRARATMAMAAMLALAAGGAVRGDQPRIEVMKTATCGCCTAWIEHMEAAGWPVVAEDLAPGLLVREKLRLGIPPGLASCHTAEVGGYVIEGHVPAADVARLLAEKPDAIGLAVPGMPVGSPGMEMGERQDPYEVLLIGEDGARSVFSRY